MRFVFERDKVDDIVFLNENILLMVFQELKKDHKVWKRQTPSLDFIIVWIHAESKFRPQPFIKGLRAVFSLVLG